MFRRTGPVPETALNNLRLEYPTSYREQVLVFSGNVITYLMSKRQMKPWHKEAGGQLFARVTPYEIFVVEATGPRRTDFRTRTSYKPDRRAEQIEIDERFEKGLIFVGDWHSHPEKFPSPSSIDSGSMTECFRKSTHSLAHFILVIIGTNRTWEGTFIGLYSRGGLRTVLQHPA